MTLEVATILAGFGGQGLLVAGTVLARAAMDEGLETFWIPSYGPEMRGGTASCTVIVADRPIGSPAVDRADVVVALNPPSLARFEPIVVPLGLLVINSSLIEAEPSRTDLEVVAIPCTALARSAGDERLTSVVALGAVLARRPFLPVEAVRRALAAVVGEKHPEILAADLAAFAAGFEAGRPGRPAPIAAAAR